MSSQWLWSYGERTRVAHSAKFSQIVFEGVKYRGVCGQVVVVLLHPRGNNDNNKGEMYKDIRTLTDRHIFVWKHSSFHVLRHFRKSGGIGAET